MVEEIKSLKDVIEEDPEILSDIKALIEEKASPSLLAIFADFHSADIAEVINHLDVDNARYVFNLLDTETAGEVITEIDENLREKILQEIDTLKIADIVDELDADDATDIVSELPDQIAEEVLENIEPEASEDVKELLKFEEDTAGGLMNTIFVNVNEDAIIADAIEQVRKYAEDVDHIYQIYVLNDNEELLGLVPIKYLLIHPLNTKLKTVLSEEFITVTPDVDQEEVANLMKKYDLLAVPVVDSNGRMLGRITIDDIMDVLDEEAEEDIQKFAGLSDEEEHTDNSFKISRNRLPWLFVSLFGELISAVVLSSFQASIEKIVIASFFIPIVMAMGGSSGTQAAIVMVRRLTEHDVWISYNFKKIFKEFLVGLLNGVICAAVLMVATHFFFKAELLFSVILAVSLILIMIFSTVVGSTIPLFLKRFGIDPAIATGPFVATMNDIFGLTIYLSIITFFFL
jgi:magnesium transporter